MGFPGGSEGEKSARNAGDPGSIPGGQHGNPLQHSCLENPYRQRSLADTTEQLSTAQFRCGGANANGIVILV